MVTKIKQIILTALLLCASPAFATDLYWVGGSGNTNDGLVAHWATSSGATYVELATQPTAYDNCIFDANSNNASYTVTINQELTCKNFIWDNPSSGTTTLQSISRTLNVYGDFQLPSGMNWLHSSIVNLVSTSTNNTIKTNGVIMKSNLLQFNIGSATGVWSLLDDFNTTYDNGTTGFKGYALRVLTGGTFNTNGNNMTLYQISGISPTASTTWNLGSSTITISNCNVATGGGISGTATNPPSLITLNAGTSNIARQCVSAESASSRQNSFRVDGKSWYRISLMDGDMFATTLTSAPSVDGSGTSIYHLYIDKDATPNYGGMVRLIDYSTTSITILDTNGNSTKKCRVSGTTSGLPAFLKLAPGIHQTLYLDIGDSVAGRGDIKQIGGGKWFVGRDSLHTAGSSGFIEDYYRQKSSRRR